MRFLRLRASGRGGVPVREKDFAEALDFNLVELDVDGMEWVPNGVLDIYILPSSPYSFVPICAVSPCLVHGHMPGFDSPCGLPATEDSGLQAFSYCVPSGKKHPSARQSSALHHVPSPSLSPCALLRNRSSLKTRRSWKELGALGLELRCPWVLLLQIAKWSRVLRGRTAVLRTRQHSPPCCSKHAAACPHQGSRPAPQQLSAA